MNWAQTEMGRKQAQRLRAPGLVREAIGQARALVATYLRQLEAMAKGKMDDAQREV